MIKIAISGASGKMGKTLIALAQKSENLRLGAVLGRGDHLEKMVDDFDILVDFTHPAATLDYLNICLDAKKSMVIGTTGFDAAALKKIECAKNEIALVVSPNMSIGVNLMFALIRIAARTIGNDSDIEIVEAHHRQKIDAPSGTALKMGEIVAEVLGVNLKNSAVYAREKMTQPRAQNTIGFSSIRGGDVIGEHTAHFLLAGERIEITHKAASREIFAKGALEAAAWLHQKPPGLYSMGDVIGA